MLKYLLSKKKLVNEAVKYEKLSRTQEAELLKLHTQVAEMKKKGYDAACFAYDQLLKRCSYTKEAQEHKTQIFKLMEYFR